MGQNLYLEVNQEVKVDMTYYIVEGWIEFSAIGDGCSWREYKLRKKQGSGYKWLSIDENYHEYAIYEMTRNKELFNEVSLNRDDYKEVDSDKASVLDYRGNVDVERGERVSFKEYEDRTEERIRAVEYWGNEIEYSTGYYLDANEIVPLQNISYSNHNASSYLGYNSHKGKSLHLSVWCVIALIVIGIVGITANATSGKVISEYLKSASGFTYVTSITSDIDSSKKADVYKTDASVDTATKNILKAIANKVVNVDENAEGGTVAILTKGEYALVYTSEDNETLVQVSDREYVYSSRTTPYRSYANTSSYYRRYYYSKGYTSDSKRYKKATSGYEDYTGSTVEVNSSNQYKTYTNTIKQQSTASRSSSGGGTSSGK